MTLIASRSFIARYPSGTPSRFVTRSNTRPGSILPSSTSGSSSSNVRADGSRTAGDRDVVEERSDTASGIDAACGTPTRPTAPPARAMLSAVTVDSSYPTHSSTECAPRPPVSSLHAFDRLVATLADDVRRPELARQRDAIRVTAEHDDLLGAEPAGGNHAAQTDRAVADDGHDLARADLRRTAPRGVPCPSRRRA